MFQFFCFLIFIYCVISYFEWFLHHYVMHSNGFAKPIMDYYKLKNSHLDHHIECKLDQSLPDDFIEEGIVFNMKDGENIALCILLFMSAYVYWQFFPRFKQSFSLSFVFGFIFLISVLYFYIWSSIHSHYHNRYVEANQPLKNNPQLTIYSPYRFFIPNDSSFLYKYLYKYHTLHHLNKGQVKCNYNIICPMFDYLFGTYKANVDNTLYFSKTIPSSEREVWLKNHMIFDIRMMDHNKIEYKDNGSTEWHLLPAL